MQRSVRHIDPTSQVGPELGLDVDLNVVEKNIPSQEVVTSTLLSRKMFETSCGNLRNSRSCY
jgi:hypothetical protein